LIAARWLPCFHSCIGASKGSLPFIGAIVTKLNTGAYRFYEP
jgi:hypothetical protein